MADITNNAIYCGYDGAIDNKRRKAQVINLKSEDDLLRRWDRDKLVSNARSLRRNSSIVRWALDTHKANVATFSFECRSADTELNRRVETLFDWWSRPINCDVTAQHSFFDLIQIAEDLRSVDGDCLIYRLADGRLQIIEGDRVRTPTDMGDYVGTFTPKDFDKYVHGVLTDDNGKPLKYAVCERTYGGIGGSGYRLTDIVLAKDAYFYRNVDRPAQVRGVSRLASAVNTFRDIYEAAEYALAKMKTNQILTMAITRPADGNSEAAAEPLRFDFGSGPQVVQLDPGDAISLLESGTPSVEFQQYMERMTSAALKAFNIPYSFYDEAYTNYSGARQALIQYNQWAEGERNQLRNLLNSLVVWRLTLFIADGHLTLPNGWTLDQVAFEFISGGLPWIDPQKEANANIALIDAGLKSPQMACKESGEDYYKILDQIADAKKYREGLGLTPADLAGALATSAPTSVDVTDANGDVVGSAELPPTSKPSAKPNAAEKPSEAAPAASGDVTATAAPEVELAAETGQQLQTTTATVLNGAQITSAFQIVTGVKQGTLDRDSGLGMLTVLFNLTDAQADKIMGSAGTKPPTPIAPPNEVKVNEGDNLNGN